MDGQMNLFEPPNMHANYRGELKYAPLDGCNIADEKTARVGKRTELISNHRKDGAYKVGVQNIEKKATLRRIVRTLKIKTKFRGEKQMNDLMVFEGHEVEVFDFEGQILFNPYHVGKCLELGDSAVKMAVSKMNDKQVVKLTNSKVKKSDFRKLHNTGENFITESGVYKLVFKSHKPNAENSQIGLLMKCFLHYARQDVMRCRNSEQSRKCIRRVYRQ